MGIKRAFIVGNVTRDADVHGKMAAFTVAVNDRERNAETGEWEDVADFIDCKVLGERGVKLSAYLTKGTKVAIHGRIKQERWETKDGSKRSALRIIADDIEFLSSREQRQEPRETYAGDDIPF